VIKYLKREQSVNGWYVSTNPYDCRDYKYTPLHQANNSYSFNVHLCPNCSRAYESVWEYGAGYMTYYYEDFPTLGLRRIECKLCGNNGN
jgi:hypothetical protein